MLAEIARRLSGVPAVDELRELKRIDERQTEAVIWARNVPEDVHSFLHTVSSGPFVNGRFRLNVRDMHACVLAHFDANEIAMTSPLDWFASDVQTLADEVAKLFQTRNLRLRLEAITHDACRKFHADNVKARLICTYSGPGTEIGLSDDAKEPDDVRRVPTGQPILLKGLQWQGGGHRQLKHRSPRIEGTGQTRFVVVLEPVTPETEQLNGTYLPFRARP